MLRVALRRPQEARTRPRGGLDDSNLAMELDRVRKALLAFGEEGFLPPLRLFLCFSSLLWCYLTIYRPCCHLLTCPVSVFVSSCPAFEGLRQMGPFQTASDLPTTGTSPEHPTRSPRSLVHALLLTWTIKPRHEARSRETGPPRPWRGEEGSLNFIERHSSSAAQSINWFTLLSPQSCLVPSQTQQMPFPLDDTDLYMTLV